MLKPCTTQDEFILTDQTLKTSNRGMGFKDLHNEVHRFRSREAVTATAAAIADMVTTGALHLPSKEGGQAGQD